MAKDRERHKRPVVLTRIGPAVREARELREWTRPDLSREATDWLVRQFADKLKREYGDYDPRDLQLSSPSITAVELRVNEPTARDLAGLVNVLGLDANYLLHAKTAGEFSLEARQLAAMYDRRRTETAKRMMVASAVSIAEAEDEYLSERAQRSTRPDGEQ